MKNNSRRIIRLAALIATVLFPLKLPANNIVWTNLAGGNWSATNNWSPNSLPGATDSAFITNSGTYTVTLDVAATFAGLTVGGTSGTQTVANSSQVLTINGPGIFNTNTV